MQTTDTIDNILGCYADIDELKDEMEEWRDNMPGSLQSSDKYSMIDSAASALDTELEHACDELRKLLEQIPRDENELRLLDLKLTYWEQKMYKGYAMPRWVRLNNPMTALTAMAEKIEEHKDSIVKDLVGAGKNEEEVKSEISEYLSTIDSALSDLQGVEFPGMFG